MNQADVEMGAPEKSMMSSALGILEAGALLTIWSLLVINEGSIRLVGTLPSNLDRPGEDPSPYYAFFGGVFEVAFGVLGLAIGFAAFITRWHSAALTKMSMVIQTLLGYYVFIVYVFVLPAKKASNLAEPLSGLSLASNKFLIVLGILTSFHFCLALQGGQFVFMARLVAAATGEDFLKQKSGNVMRSCFWNANFALSGLWTLITGSLINSQVGSGRLETQFESPPNVGTLPGLTIFVGLLMLVWGIVGIILGLYKSAPAAYFLGTGIVYIFALLNFGIAQLSTLENANEFGGAVALHNGLSFMVVFLGPYFVYKASNEENPSEL